jgi:hypothetical protein
LGAPLACAAAAVAPGAAAAPAVRSTTALANHCFALTSSGRVVAHAGAGYRAVPRGAGAAAFYLKPTGPGSYMLYDDDGQLLGVEPGAVARVGGAELARPFAEWRIARAGARTFRVTFRRQRTGTRTFDLNKDGVAHYGLFADLLADMGRQPNGGRALAIMFRSAEAYLEMWRRAGAGS